MFTTVSHQVFFNNNPYEDLLCGEEWFLSVDIKGDALNWFKSQLKERTLFLHTGVECLSSTAPLTCEMPQTSSFPLIYTQKYYIPFQIT